ncbi:hypothetical protein, partial [Serratia proteamaculans]|uniref:hypothetical protein n=1 Tax=Serratia proteamaculans TaxID=28151 RepID=UPI001BAF6BA2
MALAANKILLMTLLSARFDKPLPFYTRHLSSRSVVTCLQGPSMVLALSGPLQAAFKSVPDRFVA